MNGIMNETVESSSVISKSINQISAASEEIAASSSDGSNDTRLSIEEVKKCKEVFKDIYRYRKTFRYCDDGFKFLNREDEVGYNNWYNSLSDREKFDLYYEGTTVD